MTDLPESGCDFICIGSRQQLLDWETDLIGQGTAKKNGTDVVGITQMQSDPFTQKRIQLQAASLQQGESGQYTAEKIISAWRESDT